MSRIRKAAITAGFTYAQYVIAIAAGLLLVPLTLHRIGPRAWGLWLASGEILGHAGMVELGVVGVLPWMLAEADGSRDRDRMRTLVANGFWICSGVGIIYASLAFGVWQVLPSLLRLTSSDRTLLAAPLALLVFSNAVTYPLRVLRAVLVGLQDAKFSGMLTIVNSALEVLITGTLILKGYGLYALALGEAVPPLVILIAGAIRVAVVAPDLLGRWPRPSAGEIRALFANGVGVWLSSVGWQLLAATNATVMTVLGFPEWVPVYSCTAKLSNVSTGLAWVVPDSGLVGLAQLSGDPEGRGRVRHMTMMMLRLHLLIAGLGACGYFIVNPAFVTRWVGGNYFGGLTLNALLAAGIVLASIIHGLITTSSVLGNRLRVGVVTLGYGVVQTILAALMGHFWGIAGIAGAGLLAGVATAVPAGIALLGPSTALTARELASECVVPWLVRSLPIVGLSGLLGFFSQSIGVAFAFCGAAIVATIYLWHMRPLYVGLPLEGRWSEILVRVGLLPTAAAPPPAVAVVEQV